MPGEANFSYRACHFICAVQSSSEQNLFTAQVEYLGGLNGVEPCLLPKDADPYGTYGEAMRHAQRQATRWVNDRTGDGQGQF